MLSYFDKKPNSSIERSTKIVGGVTEVISESEKITSKWVSEGLKPNTKNTQKSDDPAKSEPKFIDFI